MSTLFVSFLTQHDSLKATKTNGWVETLFQHFNTQLSLHTYMLNIEHCLRVLYITTNKSINDYAN